MKTHKPHNPPAPLPQVATNEVACLVIEVNCVMRYSIAERSYRLAFPDGSQGTVPGIIDAYPGARLILSLRKA